MNEPQVLMFGIALHVIAGLGATSFGWLDDKLGGKRTIIISLIGLNVGGVLMLMARSVIMFWAFGLLLGVFIGPAPVAYITHRTRVRRLQTGFALICERSTASFRLTQCIERHVLIDLMYRGCEQRSHGNDFQGQPAFVRNWHLQSNDSWRSFPCERGGDF